MKKIICLFVVIISVISIPLSVNAATGKEGYAIFRDGVFFNMTWHAGMMDEPSSSDYKPVLHHSGSGVVKWDHWSNFLDGNTFKGYYKPKSGISSAYRDSVKAMGRRLRTENISYNVAYQVQYPSSRYGKWVFPADISSIRCDGVVEYVYEYYAFRIYGSNSRWDVTWGDFWNKDDHSGFAVTPKSQAQSNMTKLP